MLADRRTGRDNGGKRGLVEIGGSRPYCAGAREYNSLCTFFLSVLYPLSLVCSYLFFLFLRE
jgi:hypothetical protein